MLQISHPPSSILIQLNPIYLTDPLYLSHWVSQGVSVVLVYDWIGSLWPSVCRFFEPLKQAGAQVVAYNPPGFASGIGLLSRNHRNPS